MFQLRLLCFLGQLLVAFYLPNCRSTEIATADEDGILTDAISGQGYKTLGNDSVFLAFI